MKSIKVVHLHEANSQKYKVEQRIPGTKGEKQRGVTVERVWGLRGPRGRESSGAGWWGKLHSNVEVPNATELDTEKG